MYFCSELIRPLSEVLSAHAHGKAPSKAGHMDRIKKGSTNTEMNWEQLRTKVTRKKRSESVLYALYIF